MYLLCVVALGQCHSRGARVVGRGQGGGLNRGGDKSNHSTQNQQHYTRTQHTQQEDSHILNKNPQYRTRVATVFNKRYLMSFSILFIKVVFNMAHYRYYWISILYAIFFGPRTVRSKGLMMSCDVLMSWRHVLRHRTPRTLGGHEFAYGQQLDIPF